MMLHPKIDSCLPITGYGIHLFWSSDPHGRLLFRPTNGAENSLDKIARPDKEWLFIVVFPEGTRSVDGQCKTFS